MATEDEEVKEIEEDAPPKKSKLKLIIIASAVLVLGAGGFFGWKWYAGKKAEGDTDQKQHVSLVFPLKSFIVNLADNTGAGKRYLKISMELEVGGEEKKAMIETHIAELRDTILLLLSSRSLKEVNTLEGKLELKQALLARMNSVLGEGLIQRVYFTEFVVQ
jgi:flagellar FliL protein